MIGHQGVSAMLNAGIVAGLSVSTVVIGAIIGELVNTYLCFKLGTKIFNSLRLKFGNFLSVDFSVEEKEVEIHLNRNLKELKFKLIINELVETVKSIKQKIKEKDSLYSGIDSIVLDSWLFANSDEYNGDFKLSRTGELVINKLDEENISIDIHLLEKKKIIGMLIQHPTIFSKIKKRGFSSVKIKIKVV